MIRLMKKQEILQTAELLHAMAIEVYPDTHSTDDRDYVMAIKEHIVNGDAIYIDDEFNGLFVVRKGTDYITPDLIIYEGVRVYVKPEKRCTRLLHDFYTRMFTDFTDGDIIGITDINSNHIPILEKRHERIANVYKLKRG